MSVTPSLPPHLAFCDESQWNEGRFRALAVVSGTPDGIASLERRVADILRECGISEYKWAKANEARMRAAHMMVEALFEELAARRVRADVMIWDTHDSRHAIRGRDDAANLARMYHHLLVDVLSRRWPDGTRWVILCDRYGQIDWNVSRSCLSAKEIALEPASLFSPRHPDLGSVLLASLEEQFRIESLREADSKEEVLIQLADLLAGLAAFSCNRYDDFEEWLCKSEPSLFDDDDAGRSPSNKDLRRFEFLRWFDQECKRRKMSVSLATERGLMTYPGGIRHGLDFWRYRPQHPADQAPTKERHAGQSGARR